MSMLKWLNWAALLAAVFVICSCAGRLTLENVDVLRSNPATTKADLIQALGQPDGRLARADGVEVYTYTIFSPYGHKSCHFAFRNDKLVGYSEQAGGIYQR